MDVDALIYLGTGLGALLTGAASYVAGRQQGRRSSRRPPPMPPRVIYPPTDPDESQQTTAIFRSAVDQDGHPLVRATDGSGRLVRVATAEDLESLRRELHAHREESSARHTTMMLAIEALQRSVDPPPADGVG